MKLKNIILLILIVSMALLILLARTPGIGKDRAPETSPENSSEEINEENSASSDDAHGGNNAQSEDTNGGGSASSGDAAGEHGSSQNGGSEDPNTEGENAGASVPYTAHIKEEHRALIDSLVESALIRPEGDCLLLTYEQPDIPDDQHLTAEFYVYKEKENGEEEAILTRANDTGWPSENSIYSPEAHTEEWPAEGVKDPEGLFILLRFEVFDIDKETSETGSLLACTYTQNFDGTCSCITQMRYPAGDDYETAFYEDRTVCPAFSWRK